MLGIDPDLPDEELVGMHGSGRESPLAAILRADSAALTTELEESQGMLEVSQQLVEDTGFVVSSLRADVAKLQAENARLVASLAQMATQQAADAEENCRLRRQLGNGAVAAAAAVSGRPSAGWQQSLQGRRLSSIV